jgi:hypothetical protein
MDANFYSIENLISIIQDDLTIFGALPKSLPDNSIRQYIETQALPWFYINYIYSVIKMYYHIHHHGFQRDNSTGHFTIDLPPEIESISWLYRVRDTNLLQLGLNTPNLSINLGTSAQPYLSSYISSIGDLGVYKTTIDSLSSMLDEMTLFTVKYDFNPIAHRLAVLTHVTSPIIAECHARIPMERLFADGYFIKYVTAWSRMQQGRLLGRYDYVLPGGVKINSTDMIAQGKEEMAEVIKEINDMKNSSGFFLLVKK